MSKNVVFVVDCANKDRLVCPQHTKKFMIGASLPYASLNTRLCVHAPVQLAST